jgi:hypothetical protein
MTYPPGGPGYPGAQQSGTYPPTTQFAKADEGPSKLPLYLLAGVAILGLVSYLLSFGPVWKSGVSGSGGAMFGIIAALFAALFAIVAMLPKQGNYTPVVTATASVGFLVTIWGLVKGGGGAGWALIAIVVMCALQTVLAISALLLEAGVISPPPPRPKYDPYQQYGGGYYGQPQYGGPPSAPPGPPSAPPGPPSGAQGPSSHGPQSFGPPQGFPPYGGYPAGGFAGQGHQVGPPTPPTGFPTYAQPPGPGAGGEQQPPAPAQESPTQQVRTPEPPTQQVRTQEPPTQQVRTPEPPTQKVRTQQTPAEQQSPSPSAPPPS